MKKKDVILIIIISVILSLAMIFFNIKRENNIIIDKTQDEEIQNNSQNPVKENDSIIINNDSNSENVTNQKVVVYISGEVKNPQVVEMKTGDRLIDAIEKCGGMTDDADKNAVNLALLLKDEDHYVVPKKGETIINSSNNAISSNPNSSNLVNINTADKSQLSTLPSIGEKTAEKIIQYRESNGKFKKIDDIKNVTGIGDKKFEQIKDMITI